MARLGRLESRVSLRVVAGLLSAMLHFGLFLLIALSGGRRDGVDDGETPITQLVMLESRHADHRDGIESAPLEPVVPVASRRVQPDPETIQLPSLPVPELGVQPVDVESMPPAEIPATSETALTSAMDPLSTFVMPQAQASSILQRIERFAAEVANVPRAQVTWDQDGSRYDAELVVERASNGTELDRVVAEISAEDRGRQLRTRITLIRLPFSHFTQIVDRWNPMVQMHDDEIVGRTHINSRFKVLYDSEAGPALLGKVSTAAGGFAMESTGHRREADVFREGIETNAARIALPENTHPFEGVPRDANARVHELTGDTSIRFFDDGGYLLRDRDSGVSQYGREPPGQPVYFVAGHGVTLYVRGVVAGKVLVYSPRRIVVEGSLTYAHDPRDAPDSGDYLGLVCDGDVVVAPPYVTGPGDLRIHAAVFAKRRFVVTDIDHPRPATLSIFGSLAAGSLTASEPRYATRLEYDGRFEQQRPPGFPSTNRFAAEEWDGRWTEVPDRSASDTF